MRWTSAFAAALSLAPLPAAADVTAHYDLGGATLTVEVDDGGDYRAEVPGKFTLLRRGGVEYVVIPRGAAPLVVERQAFLDLAKKMVPGVPPKSEDVRREVVVARAGEETIAGRRGTLWTIAAEKTGGNTVQAVMSADHDLAPIGAVFANVLDAGLQTFGAMIPESNFAERVREVAAKGAPLRLVLVEEVRLRSVSNAEIDAARFALPGPVLDSSAFDQAMSAPSAPSAPSPLPPLP